MVRRIAFQWTLAALALAGAGTASADPLNLTGNVENDFPLAAGNGVVRFVPHPLADGSANPNFVPVSSSSSDPGLVSGWAIKDVRLDYDKASDTLLVGVNFFGVAGSAAGSTAEPDLSGQKSISIGFDFNNSGTSQVVAGVPSDKSQAGGGVDGFTVASYDNPNSNGLENSYGATLAKNVGALAFAPSAAHPDFEFSVKNFSSIAGDALTKGFTIEGYAGSPNDRVSGEDTFRHAVLLPQPQVVPSEPLPGNDPPPVPEPATVLAWSAVLAGGLVARLRRRRTSVA